MIPSMPPAHGSPLFHATLRASPDDFRVDERLAVELSGAGEHLWLRLEKRSMNTADVAALLERAYGVGSADVGVSGLKDRRAVTRQWFSVRTPLDAGPLERAIEAMDPAGADDAARLVPIEAGRHSRKLRRGTHVANAFEITLRDVVRADGEGTADDALAERVRRLRESGFPNYLGPQRFGRDGANVVRARAWFRAPRRRTSRLQRSLWLSAARSLLFNRVCAARVEDGSWSSPRDGEPLVLDGTRSFFVPDASGRHAGDGGHVGAAGDGERDGVVDPRLAAGDVHPSGPWWGRGESPARDACATFEAAVLEGLPEFREGLERAGLAQERRALRAFPRELELQRLGPATLRLTFALPPGVFATTLLAELGTFDTPRGPETAPATGSR